MIDGRSVLGILVACVTIAAAGDAVAGEPVFRQLSGKDIRTRVVGMAITDDAHWSDHFHPGGTLIAYDMGRLKRGTWELDGDELCMTRLEERSQTTDCFEIWASGNAVQYRRDGYVVTDAQLRPIPREDEAQLAPSSGNLRR